MQKIETNEKSPEPAPETQPENKKKERSEVKFRNPKFQFDERLIEIVLFKIPTKDELQDIRTYLTFESNKKKCRALIEKFLDNRKNLVDMAKCFRQTFEELTCRIKVPRAITSKLINSMVHYKIEIGKYLDPKEGDRMLDVIPVCYIADVIELYDLKVSKKDASMFFKWIVEDKCYDRIPKLLKLTNLNPKRQVQDLIKKLIREKDYKTIRKLPHFTEIMQSQGMKREKDGMLIGAANYHFKTDGWQYLEEIFEYHPHAIVIVIDKAFTAKNSEKLLNDYENMKGIVSICERKPEIFKKLSNKTKARVLQWKQEHPNEPILKNSLHAEEFQPSNQDQFFTFKELGLSEKNITWIDQKCTGEELESIRKKIDSYDFICLDTESTVARTPLDTDVDVLALIQFCSGKDVYVLDTLNAKRTSVKTILKDFLLNPDKTVIGHTIFDDIGTVAEFFEYGRAKCRVVDIKEEFHKLKPKEKVSLKAISHNILGKEICKKYTLTNWEKRPLRKSQLHYAAMDAIIIERIWEQLQKQIEQAKTTVKLQNLSLQEA